MLANLQKDILIELKKHIGQNCLKPPPQKLHKLASYRCEGYHQIEDQETPALPGNLCLVACHILGCQIIPSKITKINENVLNILKYTKII